MRAVKGRTREERDLIRRTNQCERRATFYRHRLAKYPPGSFAALREVLDFARAVGEDMTETTREDFAGRIAALIEERNKP